MSRQRIAAARARRQAAVSASARDIDLPLPLRGLLAQAKSAKVSNYFAAEMHNVRTDGLSVFLRPGIVWGSDIASRTIQRIPFEFGGAQRYIEIQPESASCGRLMLERPFNGRAAWATNSSNVIIADGLGLPVRFDGTAFGTAEFTAAAGPDPAECDGIISHHDRVYLWQKGGELEFLVGGVGAVMGPMSRFPLGRLGNITGSILTMTSLTVAATNGPSNVLCIVTTTGQMVIYEGTDPTDAQQWQILGRVNAVQPLGDDAFAQVGADAWMLTSIGPVSVSRAMSQSTLALVSDLSRPVSKDIKAAADLGGEWSIFSARDGSMVVINHVLDGAARQFVYYVDGGTWATADYPARQWHNLGSRPEFTALDGRRAWLAWDGSDEQVTGRVVSSWFTAGAASKVHYIKPTIRSDGPMDVRCVVLSDQQDAPADIAEAEQTVRIEGEELASSVTLTDIIGCDAAGESFQITLEVTARWAEITGIKAGVGS